MMDIGQSGVIVSEPMKALSLARHECFTTFSR